MTTFTASSTIGVVLASPSYTNPIMINPDVTITGNTGGGNAISAYSGAWYITNAGEVAGVGSSGTGVYLAAGGAVSNLVGGVVGTPASNPAAIYIKGGTGTVTNAGVINAGVRLGTGGIVTNLTGGKIVSASTAGGYGVALRAPGTVNNGGQVSGLLLGVELDAGGTVTNQAGGTLNGRYAGVLMEFPGQATGNSDVLINQSGGSISGDSGVIAGGDTATLTNAGVIAGTLAGTVSINNVTLLVGDGVSLSAGGTIANQSRGTIAGARHGIAIGDGAGTVVNAGTIMGDQDAVALAAGFVDRVVVDPGGVFTGAVDGGNTIGAAAVSVLELAPGNTSGTLSGLGSQYINFAQITIDTNARWVVTGANTLAAGTTLTNNAVVALSNAILTDAGTIENDGSMTLDGATLTVGALSGVGQVAIGGGSTVTATGTVAVAQTIAFAGRNAELNLAFAGFAGDILGFNASDTIGLIGVTDAVSAAIVNDDTLQIDRSGNPAILLRLDPNQNYTGFSFMVDANGTVTDNVNRTLSWIGGDTNTDLRAATNWNDLTNGLSPAQLAPETTDTIGFDSSSGAVTGTLTVTTVNVASNGVGVLRLSAGTTLAAGSLDAGIAATAIAEIGLTGAGTELSISGPATVADDGTGVLSVLSGATFTAASLTIGNLGDSSGALVISGAGSVVNLSGALNVGTSLGTGDMTVGPGAAVHASVVNLQGQVVLEGGLLDPTVQLVGQGQTVGGFGTISAGDIIDAGVIQAGGTTPSQKLLIVQGTVLGGGTLLINGSAQASGSPGVLRIDAGGTMELTGAVLNAGSTTFADDLTPANTYTVNNSVIDVTFADASGVLLLDDIAGFGGTIASFRTGDAFVITGGTLSNLAVSNGNTLTLSDSGPNAGSAGLDTIVFGAGISVGQFSIVNSDTVRAVACFAEGTRIETEDGPVAVEALRAGDRIVTADGRVETAVWIGSRTVECGRHPKPETVWPVRVTAGAFGKNMPRRDLWLSPDHAAFVNDVLVPVKLLVNGTSIARVKRPKVTYYHVELPRHEVILAEGLPVESYLDVGDRATFHRDSTSIRLYTELAARRVPDAAVAWMTGGAAPLVMTGTTLEAARRHVETQVSGRP